MPAYKDKKRNTWYVAYRFKNRKGEYEQVWKRGFKTKKEALNWEMESKLKDKDSLRMTFETFVKDVYFPTISKRIKESTLTTKTNIINIHILPFFKNYKMDDISTADVIRWQNEILETTKEKPFSKPYLKTIHTQLVAILNFAVRYYGLNKNPAAMVANMGTNKEIEMNFWTLEEYQKFAFEMMDEPVLYYCFELLYWTGMREGEMLALTKSDFDFAAKTVSITKTFHHINGHDIITDPKTRQSKRIVTIPDFLAEDMKEYISSLYGIGDEDRMFPISKTMLSRGIHRGAKKAGIKPIRVHDLRHSHVSLLIDRGTSVLAIAKRIGHSSIDITYRYAHLFPNVQGDIAKKLEDISKE